MKKRWILLLLTLSFLFTAVMHAPVDRLHAWATAGQEPSPLQLFGLQGTVSSGKVSSVRYDGRPLIDELRWKLQPAWLAMLRLSAVLQSESSLELKMNVSRSAFGRTRINDADLRGDVKQLIRMFTPALLPVEGNVLLALQSAQFEGGLPVQVDGLAELQNLAWTLARDPVVLGSYNANLTSVDDGVLAQLANGDAPLELSGEARLGHDRKWDLRLQIKPTPRASPELLALVRSLGKPDNGGWYQIRRNGEL